jgi:Predicted methyltransferase (contains TPR repeat)
MRTILLFLLGGSLLASAQTASPAQQAETFYNKGLAAEKAGDPTTAKAAYAQALQLNPQHANARFKLGEMKHNSGTIAAKGREAKFGQVTIAQIQLEAAPLSEALDALRLAIEKAAPEKADAAPNFIIEDPDKRLANAKISLQLKGVPAKGVLEYILTQSGAKARYDEHAVVILPR